MTSSARRSASTSRLATSAMKRSAARDGIRSVRRTSPGGWPAASASATAIASFSRRTIW